MCDTAKAICDKNIFFLNQLFDKNEVEIIKEGLSDLRCKRVGLSCEIDDFLGSKLVEYSYENEMNGMKPPQAEINKEIEYRVKLIVKYSRVLRESYSTDNLNDMDIRFYTILKILFENFFFIKSRSEYRHLLVPEMTYCIAIFLKFAHLKQAEDFSIFRMLINKDLLMKYLRIFEMELVTLPRYKWNDDMFLNLVKTVNEYKDFGNLEISAIWMSLYPDFRIKKKEVSYIKYKLKRNELLSLSDKKFLSNELKEFRKLDKLISRKNLILQKSLKRTFQNLKQLYSMKRLVDCVSQVEKYTVFPESVLADCTIKDLYALKRVIQIFGESLKFTKNTPNITKNLSQMIEHLASSHLSDSTKSMRQDFSHGFSLINVFVDTKMEISNFLGMYQRYWKEITKFIFQVYDQCLKKALQIFCTNIFLLKNMKQVQTFLLFSDCIADEKLNCTGFGSRIEENDVIIKKLQKLNIYFAYDLKVEAIKMELIEILKKEMQDNLVLQRNTVKMRINLVKNQKDISVAKQMIKFHVISIQKMNDSKGSPIVQNNSKMAKYNQLRDILTKNPHLWLEKNSGSILLMELMYKLNFHKVTTMFSLTLTNDFYFIEIMKFKEYTKEIVENLGLNLSETQFELLHNELKGKYYHDIFNLTVKITVINAFCKKEAIELNPKLLNKMRRDDEHKMQEIFDDHIEILRNLMKEEKSEVLYYALEYILLVLFEMMICAGYLQDNYHFLKQESPVITGRNFRNYLAHDFVLYETLTDFDSKVTVYSNSKAILALNVKLFSKPKKRNQAKIPDLEAKNDLLLKKVSIQEDLLNSLESWNCEAFKTAISNNANIDFITVNGKTFLEHAIEKNLRKFYKFSYFEEKDEIFQFLRAKNLKLDNELLIEYILKKALLLDKKLFIDICLDHSYKITLTDLMSTPTIDFQFLSDLKKSFPSLNWKNENSIFIFCKIIKSCDVEAIKMVLGWNIEIDSLNLATNLACFANQNEILQVLLNSSIKFRTEDLMPLIVFMNNSILPLFLDKIDANDITLQNMIIQMSITGNNLGALKYFLEERKIQPSKNLLEIAASSKNPEFIKYLIQKETILNANTIFHLIGVSLHYKSFKTLKFLIKLASKRDLEIPEKTFALLAGRGHLKFMKMFKKLPSVKCPIFQAAVDTNNLKIMSFLHRKGFKIAPDALINAVQIHANKVFHHLIALDESLKRTILKNPFGEKCLFYSFLKNNYEMLQFLLDFGVNVNAICQGLCLLCGSMERDDIQALNIILSAKNVDVNNPCRLANIPIGKAISFRVFHKMVEAGANLDPLMTFRNSHLGAPFPFNFISNPMCLEYLYSTYPFDPNDQDDNGRTILHLLVSNSNVINSLPVVLNLPYMDLNSKCKAGKTALHEAVISENYEAAKMLIEKNCELDELDDDGRTPLLISVLMDSYEMTKLLFENGANVKKIVSYFYCSCKLAYEIYLTAYRKPAILYHKKM